MKKLSKIIVCFILVIALVLSTTACKPTEPKPELTPTPTPVVTVKPTPEKTPVPVTPSPTPAPTKAPGGSGGSVSFPDGWDKPTVENKIDASAIGALTGNGTYYLTAKTGDNVTNEAFTGTLIVDNKEKLNALTVDMPNATIEFRGEIGTLTVTSGQHTGRIGSDAKIGSLNLNGGRLLAESGSLITAFTIAANNTTTQIIELRGTVTNALVVPDGAALKELNLVGATLSGALTLGAGSLVSSGSTLTALTVTAGNTSTKSLDISGGTITGALTLTSGSAVAQLSLNGTQAGTIAAAVPVKLVMSGTAKAEFAPSVSGSLVVTQGSAEATVSPTTTGIALAVQPEGTKPVQLGTNANGSNLTVNAPEDKTVADLVTPPSGATLDNTVTKATVFTVKNSAELTAKLASAKAGDTIKLDGKFGSTTEYVAYTIDKKITIQGLSNNAVYGTFLIKGAGADGTIIDGINLFVRGGEKATKVLKNGIQIVSNTATVKNCVISLPNAEALAAGGDVGNGIVIWPLKEGTNSYTIFGNTFNGFKANVKDWASTAINVAENLALDRFDLTGETSEALGYTEEKELAFARDNTFVDCTYNYSRNDWGASGVQAITVVGNELFIEAGTNYTKIFAFENLSVKQNLEIKTGTTLTIAKGATLTIPKGVTLTNNGAIVNNGAIANGGAIVGKGAFTNNGTLRTVVDTLDGLKAAIAIGGNIEVKPGTYTLGSGLVIDKTVSISGAGDSTIIKADNAFNAFEIGNDSGNAFDVSISNLKITNAYQGIGLSQSKSNKLRNATISGVNFESFTSKGIYLGGASGKVIVESCKFDGNVLSPEGLPTQQRSGSGVDVDLHGLDGTVRAVTLEIKNNTFKNFQNSGSTSGAIKLKNRGGDKEDPKAGYGKIQSELTATLSGNTYINNNRDLVIGTSGILSTYPKSLTTTNDKNLTKEKTYDFANFGKTKVTTSEELVKILGAEAKYRENITIAKTFELAANAIIKAGTTLTIPAGKTLTIAAGKTLTNNGTIVVNDAASLEVALNANVAAGKVAGTVKLGSDIDMAGKAYTVASTVATSGNTDFPTSAAEYAKAFHGTFDGNGKTISNLTQPLIGYAFGNYTDSNGDTADIAGTITFESGDKFAEFKNLTLSGTVAGKAMLVGQMAGFVKFTNVTVNGSVTGAKHAAGIVWAGNDLQFIGCVNNATITATTETGKSTTAGGLVTQISSILTDNSATPVLFENCKNTGAIKTTGYGSNTWIGQLFGATYYNGNHTEPFFDLSIKSKQSDLTGTVAAEGTATGNYAFAPYITGMEVEVFRDHMIFGRIHKSVKLSVDGAKITWTAAQP